MYIYVHIHIYMHIILQHRGQHLKIQYSCKHSNNKIITYYYKNLPSPFFGITIKKCKGYNRNNKL